MKKAKGPYLTVYFSKQGKGLIEWLKAEAKRQDRSVNAVIVRILIAAKEGSSEKAPDEEENLIREHHMDRNAKIR